MRSSVNAPGEYEVGLLTWKWQYDNQSGWSFRVGKPWLEIDERQPNHRPTRSIRNIYLRGDYGLHVMASHWYVHRLRAPFVVWNDDVSTIHRRFAWLDGIRLDRVEIAEGGWLASATFEDDFRLTVLKRDGETFDSLANWFDERSLRID